MSEFVFWDKYERNNDTLDGVFVNAAQTGETGLPRVATWTRLT